MNHSLSLSYSLIQIFADFKITSNAKSLSITLHSMQILYTGQVCRHHMYMHVINHVHVHLFVHVTKHSLTHSHTHTHSPLNHSINRSITHSLTPSEISTISSVSVSSKSPPRTGSSSLTRGRSGPQVWHASFIFSVSSSDDLTSILLNTSRICVLHIE